jgi:CheY-like chemotaxis protein
VADPLRVLVVDDNRDVLHVVSKLLKLGGHTVATALDGSTGVELAREFHPDLVLCDIGLPGEMNGYKVAEALRADPATRWTRLVAVTGFGQDEDRRRAIEAGFDRHMTKPVGYADLVTLIADMDQN